MPGSHGSAEPGYGEIELIGLYAGRIECRGRTVRIVKGGIQ